MERRIQVTKKTVEDIAVAGKRVLVRVDFNVPMNMDGMISDDSRIRACLPTINYLIKKRARVILCSHLGRPKGKVTEELRLAPVAKHLSELLGKTVRAAGDCVGPEVEAAISQLQPGDVMLLENLRFHAEEEANDPDFAQALSRLANIYVNDAFGSAHRAHASTVGVANYLPAVAGFLLEKELEALGKALEAPEHPFSSLVGGAKVSDKLGLLRNIVGKVDSLLIGGGMAATFLKAKGYQVGRSAIEEDALGVAKEVMEQAAENGIMFLLPVDVVVAEEIEAQAPPKVTPITEIPPSYYIVDIGPGTTERFSTELKKSKTVFWNGPVGVYEIAQFAQGTNRIAQVLAGLKATTIIGGGSTADVVREMGLVDKMSHVSTGGGASLMFLEGKTLPGVAVLLDK
jgi:phosphoglycerate kinase